MQVADREYSRMIRRTHSDPHTGMAKCVTCNKQAHWTEMDCGHFITRAKAKTRYEPMNTWPQCRECNRMHNGRPEEFEQFLIGQFGEETVEWLHQQSNQTERYTTEDLLESAAAFRAIAQDPPNHRWYNTFPHPN